MKSRLAVVTSLAVVAGLLAASAPAAARQSTTTSGPSGSSNLGRPRSTGVKPGRLAVHVTGLPLGTQARIVVTGVKGRGEGSRRVVRVKKRTTVGQLQPGVYRVTAKSIRTPGARFGVAAVAPGLLRLDRAHGATVTVRYQKGGPVDPLPAGAFARVPLPDGMFVDGNTSGRDSYYQYVDGAGVLNVVAAQQENHVVNTEPVRVAITPFDVATSRAGAARSISFPGFPLWGGFYAAPDGCFYLVVGQNNPNEDDARQVIAVHRYDAAWNPVGVAYLTGGASQTFKGIFEPFHAGGLSMQLVGSQLVVHTARTMYMHDDGLRHQSNLTFTVDTTTMTATPFQETYGAAPTYWSTYVSHSFAELFRSDGTAWVFADLGDAYLRAITLHIAGGVTEPLRQVEVFPFLGETGDNYTGATLTGLELGGGQALAAGNSVPHANPVNGVTGDDDALQRNVYLTSTQVGTGAPTFNWITTYPPTGSTGAGEPRLVKLSDTRFVLLFNVTDGKHDSLHFRLVDQFGGVLAERSWPGIWYDPVSSPVVVGSKMFWSDGDEEVFLYGMDLTDPTTPTLIPAPKG